MDLHGLISLEIFLPQLDQIFSFHVNFLGQATLCPTGETMNMEFFTLLIFLQDTVLTLLV